VSGGVKDLRPLKDIRTTKKREESVGVKLEKNRSRPRESKGWKKEGHNCSIWQQKP